MQKQPVYKKIEQYLIRQILSGIYPLESCLPSERQIEELTGGSRVSVRRAFEVLLEHGIIEKADRRRAVVVKLPKIPVRNLAFASPREKRGLLDIYHMMFDALFSLTNANGENLYYLDISRPLPDALCKISFDTIFLAGRNTVELQKVLHANTRLIQLDDLNSSAALTVATDNYAGGRMAAEVLHASDCHNAGIVWEMTDGTRYPPNLCRHSGFADGCRKSGINFLQDFTIDDLMQGNRELFKKNFLTYLKQNKCDGLFAINDYFAVHLLPVLQELGYRIPEDIAVVGLDGLELGLYTIPPLTTVAQPVHEIAQMAYAFSHNDDAELPSKRKVLISPSVIYRNSTNGMEIKQP